MTRADFTFFSWDGAGQPHTLALRGDWTLKNYVAIGREIARFHAQDNGNAALSASRIDGSSLSALDTAGASRLVDLLGQELAGTITGPQSPLSAERSALLQTVAAAKALADASPPPPRPP